MKNRKYFTFLKIISLIVISLCWQFVHHTITVYALEMNSEDVQEGNYNGLTYLFNSEKVVITGYEGTDSNVVIPEMINGLCVTDIAEGAFKNNQYIQYVVIKVNLKTIPDSCFEGSTLVNVELPDSIIEINGFANCDKLQSITLPDNLESIGDRSFYNCESIKAIQLPEGVVEIGDAAFVGCSIEEIILPDTLEVLGASVFFECNKLKNIEIPEKIKEIKDCTFSACTNLETVVLPDTLQVIGFMAFEGCSSLSSIELPNELYSLGSYCFRRCIKLKKLKLPDNLIDVGLSLCEDCNSLNSVVLSTSMKSLPERAFSNCYSLTEIYIPSTIIEVGEDVFSSCANLVIYGECGSYAETYADEYGYSFSINEMPGLVTSEGSNEEFEYIICDNSCVITNYLGSDTEIVIPEEIDEYHVIGFAPKLFEFSSVKKVVIRSQIKELPEYCFYGSNLV